MADTVKESFDAMSTNFNADKAAGMKAVYQWDVTGDGGAFPFTIAFGILLTTVTMHLAKWIGGLHGRFAKFMLVGE